MTRNKLKYFDNPAWDTAFERCVDVLAELIEKYADKIVLTSSFETTEYAFALQAIENAVQIFILKNPSVNFLHLKKYVESQKCHKK